MGLIACLPVLPAAVAFLVVFILLGFMLVWAYIKVRNYYFHTLLGMRTIALSPIGCVHTARIRKRCE